MFSHWLSESMKVYVLSNVPGKGDSIVNDFGASNVNVVSKENESTVEEMSAAVAKAIEEGKADYVIVIASDPIKASILMNKESNVYAALCSSADDIELAKVNNANTIVVNSSMSADNFVNALLSGRQKLSFFMPKKKQEERQAEQPAPKEAQKEQKQVKSKQQQMAESKKADEPEQQVPKRGKKSGLFGALKDSLGIIDNN